MPGPPVLLPSRLPPPSRTSEPLAAPVGTPAPCRWWAAGLRQGQGLSGQHPAALPGGTPQGRPVRTQQHPLPLIAGSGMDTRLVGYFKDIYC